MTENQIAANLKYLRKKSGLSQAHIRSKLGVKRSTWSNYENGVTTPPINDLINFSRFFGISLDELILHDLSLKDPLPVKAIKKTPAKTVVYTMNEAVSTTGEADMGFVLKELRKLREEIDTIKKSKE